MMPESIANSETLSSVQFGCPRAIIMDRGTLFSAMTNSQKSCRNMESLTVSLPRIILKQVGKSRSSVAKLPTDCPDCEGSRILGLSIDSLRASNPQLHLGNPISLI
ncbi:hypothetical protein Tco_0747586 [Tanacetum coccineum]|uniref:Uncharacterized protein n=1 Tax=Tanacetum coccineum TaxID=301880 RepID=A0ABQ4YTG1_9ASTR